MCINFSSMELQHIQITPSFPLLPSTSVTPFTWSYADLKYVTCIRVLITCWSTKNLRCIPLDTKLLFAPDIMYTSNIVIDNSPLLVWHAMILIPSLIIFPYCNLSWDEFTMLKGLQIEIWFGVRTCKFFRCLWKAPSSFKQSAQLEHLFLTFLKTYFGYFQPLRGQQSNLKRPGHKIININVFTDA